MANKPERKSKIEFVPLGKIKVSEFAQRELKEYRVDELLSDFNLDLIGLPVMSFRDGSFYSIDGQHRVAAVKRFIGAGWEQQKIQCRVYTDMKETDEAEMFLRLNNVLSVHAFDKFKIAVQAGRTVETKISAVVNAQKLTVSRNGTPGAIRAVGTLLKVFKRSDAETLGRALRIIRDAYGDPGLEALVVDGIGHLCQRYNGALDEQVAKKRLAETHGGVKGLLGKAQALHLRTGNPRASCVAAAAVDIINSGRGGTKLPSWWKQA